MTTEERQDIRAGLLKLGFVRETSGEEPEHFDLGGLGIYTEVWRSGQDRTRIDLHWDRKTRPVPRGA